MAGLLSSTMGAVGAIGGLGAGLEAVGQNDLQNIAASKLLTQRAQQEQDLADNQSALRTQEMQAQLDAADAKQANHRDAIVGALQDGQTNYDSTAAAGRKFADLSPAQQAAVNANILTGAGFAEGPQVGHEAAYMGMAEQRDAQANKAAAPNTPTPMPAPTQGPTSATADNSPQAGSAGAVPSTTAAIMQAPTVETAAAAAQRAASGPVAGNISADLPSEQAGDMRSSKGTLFGSHDSALTSMNMRRLTGMQPAPVDGGWVLRATGTPTGTPAIAGVPVTELPANRPGVAAKGGNDQIKAVAQAELARRNAAAQAAPTTEIP